MRKKSGLADWPEVFFSSSDISARVSSARRRGELRELGPRLYTSRLDLEPADALRRHWQAVVAGYFPGSVIGFRTALEGKPGPQGEVFVTGHLRRVIHLDGLHINAVEGPGPLVGDMPLPHGLFWASRARALLESARPSRARRQARRGLRNEELETWLERFLAIEGEARLNALRDQMCQLATEPPGDESNVPPLPDSTDAFSRLDTIIGALLGTRGAQLSTPAARARRAGTPLDAARLEIFGLLHAFLAGAILPVRSDPAPAGRASRNLAFLDAYFSNYIEGTEFEIAEAREIVFDGRIIPARIDDTHDVVGTFDLLTDPGFMKRAASQRQDADEFLADLQAANRRILAGRPAKRPGEFKEAPNRAGNTVFVAPELVRGTLSEGYMLLRSLEHPFARAAAMMFLISEVHPFDDGNGRVARAFMNAELVAAGQCRILIPTVFREDYLGALRALSRQQRPEPFVQALQYAQQLTSMIPYDDLDDAIRALERAHAFDDDPASRLRLPSVDR